MLLLLLLGVFVVTACGDKDSDSGRKKDKKTDEVFLTKEEINDKLTDVNNDLTDFWNDVVCDVSWYTSSGTSATGEVLDIEFLVKHSDKYYNKIVKNKEFVDSLGEDYQDLIDAYDKAVEQGTIIYDAIHEELPVANTEPSYKENIELFKQYSDYFWDGVYELED